MKKTILLLITAVLAIASWAADNRKEALKALKEHKTAHVKDGWIRDPYIVLGPDNVYYLTGTTPNPGDPREFSEPLNTGLGDSSLVGGAIQIWKSTNLVDWEYVGAPYSLENTVQYQGMIPGFKKGKVEVLWAPEIHWADGKWVMVHCPKNVSNLVLSQGDKMEGPWTNPAPAGFNQKHDPSLFLDTDGTWFLAWGDGYVARIKPGFKGLAEEPKRIVPAGRNRIGHEGTTIMKIGEKYIFIGTGWSTDNGRKEGGSYNLYYCTSDNIYGPYTERRFIGRFLGHGTPFRDKDGKWWCTAFFNGDVAPLDPAGIEKRNLKGTAQTINKSGTTLVPLEVKILPDGDVYIRATDPHYATPGPDEAQKF